jgi:hypothetical protein
MNLNIGSKETELLIMLLSEFKDGPEDLSSLVEVLRQKNYCKSLPTAYRYAHRILAVRKIFMAKREISEKKGREILRVPELKRAELLEKVAEKVKRDRVIPSAQKIRGLVNPQHVTPLAVKAEVWKLEPESSLSHMQTEKREPVAVEVNEFEIKFGIEAVKAGLPYGESHVAVSVQTVPNKTYRLPNGVLHVFFDGPIEDRDEGLRDVLRSHGEKVLAFPYERATDDALQQAIEQVRTELLRLGWTPNHN